MRALSVSECVRVFAWLVESAYLGLGFGVKFYQKELRTLVLRASPADGWWVLSVFSVLSILL